MGIIIGIIGIIFPRIVAILLWLFTNWFSYTFETKLWPILGFIFFPLVMLWCSAIGNWFHGDWNWWRIGFVILAVIIDLIRWEWWAEQ